VVLSEVVEVLTIRLSQLYSAPPLERQGRVLVGTPDEMRGRTARVVFIPGLSERVFPQRVRPDPLLSDLARRELNTACAGAPRPSGKEAGQQLRIDFAATGTGVSLRVLPVDADRTHDERLRLHIGVGAATERLYASFSSMDAASARPRVPS